MKIAAAVAAIVVALALQTTLAGLFVRGTAALDLVLVVVIYISLVAGPATGVLAATVAGLIQDSLSSGILGIGGLAKTIVAFLAGVIGTQFIVTAPLSRFMVFLLGTAVHAAIFMGLYVLLDLRQFPNPYGGVAGQAVGNAFVGVVGFQLVEWLPGFVARRRAGRPLRR